VAALNAGVIAGTDLLDVADQLYLYKGDDDGGSGDDGYIDLKVSFDPKYPDMAQVLLDTATVGNTKYQQRIGYSLWDVEFSGWLYDWQGSDATSDKWDTPTFTGPFQCPAKCETTVKFCNTPDFVFSYSQVGSDSAFKLNIYAAELFTMNLDNMDPGFFGCATNTVGSKGKLGHLDPVSTAAFASNLNAQPFKLVEDYFACTPIPVTAFFDSLGIANGNAGLFVAVTVALMMFIAGRVGMVKDSNVSPDEIAAKSQALAEAVKLFDSGDTGAFTAKHKDLQASLRGFLAADIVVAEKKTRKGAKKGANKKDVESADAGGVELSNVPKAVPVVGKDTAGTAF
jgi:hypothetical protein